MQVHFINMCIVQNCAKYNSQLSLSHRLNKTEISMKNNNKKAKKNPTDITQLTLKGTNILLDL